MDEEVEWPSSNMKVTGLTPPAPPETITEVSEQDTELLIAPDEQFGTLPGSFRHQCVNERLRCKDL